MNCSASWARPTTQRGLSLVEMMVGIAVGLFVVAAASMLVATQLSDNRRLLLETQVQQDLRAALDIITRELRRAGAQSATLAQLGLATAAGTAGLPNAFAAVDSVTSTPSAEVGFRYMRQPGEEGPYGFKLEGGAIKTRMADAGWQDLTDSKTVEITGFTVTAQDAPLLRLPCARLCADGGTACWPSLMVRELVVEVEGRAASDNSVRRQLQSRVRLRNDWIRFNDAVNANQVCPS